MTTEQRISKCFLCVDWFMRGTLGAVIYIMLQTNHSTYEWAMLLAAVGGPMLVFLWHSVKLNQMLATQQSLDAQAVKKPSSGPTGPIVDTIIVREVVDKR